MLGILYGSISRFAVTIVCGFALLAQTTAAYEESSTGIAKELEIMSKVLEASLDSSGIEDWHASSIGYSAFQSKIKREYIPTVGAIFTIDVNFPIVKPEEDVAKAGEGEKKRMICGSRCPKGVAWTGGRRTPGRKLRASAYRC